MAKRRTKTTRPRYRYRTRVVYKRPKPKIKIPVGGLAAIGYTMSPLLRPYDVIKYITEGNFQAAANAFIKNAQANGKDVVVNALVSVFGYGLAKKILGWMGIKGITVGSVRITI